MGWQFFGWTFRQWVIAFGYYNTCNPSDLREVPTPREFAGFESNGVLDRAVHVAEFWRKHRIDEPGEIQIALDPWYGQHWPPRSVTKA